MDACKVRRVIAARWTKTDWAYWTACLTDNREDFDAITGPIYDYLEKTPRRVGFADLYFTDQPNEANFHARPVIGGIFIKLLYDSTTWKKWAVRDKTKAFGPWAPLPVPQETVSVIKPGDIDWKYTTQKPGDSWNAATFDDANWQSGKGGFGSDGTPGVNIKTKWDTADIWLRGEVTIPTGNYNRLHLSMYHDEDAQVFIDGKQAVNARLHHRL